MRRGGAARRRGPGGGRSRSRAFSSPRRIRFACARETRTRVINHACPISGLSLLRHAVKPDNRPVRFIYHVSRFERRSRRTRNNDTDDILINCMTRARDASSPSNSLYRRTIATISISSGRHRRGDGAVRR